jgi:hypothetical protein
MNLSKKGLYGVYRPFIECPLIGDSMMGLGWGCSSLI